MNRGDVCWLELPEEGRRPVCVLTRRDAIPVLRNVLVALVTRTVRNIPTEVRMTADDGMAVECAISLDNVRTVPRALLTEQITSLSGTRMHEVCRALAAATGCD
ncbi:MAG TPA: type II toxin-antitoxin system PemK/MazF family toxin [Solirubrobacteraceae bacterium]|nr:type II toxin-antitoxin system PemK/MazF family toxin [Solirubrobacteraceae bacterium]